MYITLAIFVAVFLLVEVFSELLRPRPRIDDFPVPPGRVPVKERVKTGLFTSVEIVTGYEGDGFDARREPRPEPTRGFLDIPDPKNPYRAPR